MLTRTSELEVFLATMHASILERADDAGPVAEVANRIFHALQSPKNVQPTNPAQIRACGLLDQAIENVLEHESASAAQTNVKAAFVGHAKALASLSPQLTWKRRPGAEQVSETFASGHANATIIGKGGLEERADVWIGVSLLAPNIVYPEHHHLPEEVYVVLSPGQWQANRGEWHEPGIGGIVHNAPDILHSMRSDAVPLLATWCLWSG